MTLANKMRKLADTGHPRAVELRERAQALEEAQDLGAEGWSAERMVGRWARARRLWCDITGEPLV